MTVERHRRWSDNIEYDVEVERDAQGRFVAIHRYEYVGKIVDESLLPDEWTAKQVRDNR